MCEQFVFVKLPVDLVGGAHQFTACQDSGLFFDCLSCDVSSQDQTNPEQGKPRRLWCLGMLIDLRDIGEGQGDGFMHSHEPFIVSKLCILSF